MQVVIPEGVSPGMPFQVNTLSGPMQVVCPPGAAAGSPIMVHVPVNVVAQAVAQPIVVAAQPMEEPIMMGTAMDVSQAPPSVVGIYIELGTEEKVEVTWASGQLWTKMRAHEPPIPSTFDGSSISVKGFGAAGKLLANGDVKYADGGYWRRLPAPLTSPPVIQKGATVSGSAPAPQSMSMQRSEMDGRMNEAASGCYGLKSLPCCYIGYASVSPEGVSVGPCCCCFGLCICPCPGWGGNFKPIAPGSATFKEPSDGTTWTFTSPTAFVANGGTGGAKDELHVRYC